MATIDSKDLIDAIIAANGRQYDDEPPVSRIVEYTNHWGTRTWGVVWETEGDQYRYETTSPYIRNPKVIFVREDFLSS